MAWMGSVRVSRTEALLIVLPQNAVIVLSSTVSPSSAIYLQSLLDKAGKGHQLVDAPTSGGPSRGDTGDIAIMASGDPEALSRVCTVLQAMSTAAGNQSNLHFIRKYLQIIADDSRGRRIWLQGQSRQQPSRLYPHGCRR